MNNIDKRIADLRAAMLPLQQLYGLTSRTIEERYQEIQARKTTRITKTRPGFRLPKL
jgi:hypothetical protein